MDVTRLQQELQTVAQLIQQNPIDDKDLADATAVLYQTLEAVKAQDLNEDDEKEALAVENKLNQFKADLRGVLDRSHGLMRRYGSVFEKADDFQGLQPSVESLREVMTMSHRLAYSAFAPSGYEMGDQLRAFKPPAPQASHFLASKLHDFDVHYQSMLQQQRSSNSPSSSEKEEIQSPGKRVKVKHDELQEMDLEGDKSDMDETLVKKERSESVQQMEVDRDAAMKSETDPSAFVLNPDLEDELESSSLEETSSQDL